MTKVENLHKKVGKILNKYRFGYEDEGISDDWFSYKVNTSHGLWLVGMHVGYRNRCTMLFMNFREREKVRDDELLGLPFSKVNGKLNRFEVDTNILLVILDHACSMVSGQRIA